MALYMFTHAGGLERGAFCSAQPMALWVAPCRRGCAYVPLFMIASLCVMRRPARGASESSLIPFRN